MSNANVEHFIDHGWTSIPVFEPQSLTSLADEISSEALQLVFNDDLDGMKACQDDDIHPSQLLVDSGLRQKYLKNPKMVWTDGNTLRPIISKSTGMCNLYHNPHIRDWIYFNPIIYNHIKALYDAVDISRKGEDLVYMHGPDRVGFKPQGSTDMGAHLDRSLFDNTYLPTYRVQSMVTVSIGTPNGNITSSDMGSLKVLQNFHHYFHLAQQWYSTRIKVDQWTYKPWVLPKEFNDFLPEFIEWIQKLYNPVENGIHPESPEYKAVMATVPITYKPIEWISPPTQVGHLLCFDFRLPHHNTRNKSPVTRICTYVSLYRKSDWLQGIKQGLCTSHILKTFTGELGSTHGGINAGRYDVLEQSIFASTWKARVSFDSTVAHVELVCGINNDVHNKDKTQLASKDICKLQVELVID
jgi:hypothetical protein